MATDKDMRYLLGMALQLGSSVAGSALIFIFLGIFLDNKFNSHPRFLVSGIFLGFTFAIFLVFKIANKAIDNKIKK